MYQSNSQQTKSHLQSTVQRNANTHTHARIVEKERPRKKHNRLKHLTAAMQ